MLRGMGETQYPRCRPQRTAGGHPAHIPGS